MKDIVFIEVSREVPVMRESVQPFNSLLHFHRKFMNIVAVQVLEAALEFLQLCPLNWINKLRAWLGLGCLITKVKGRNKADLTHLQGGQ